MTLAPSQLLAFVEIEISVSVLKRVTMNSIAAMCVPFFSVALLPTGIFCGYQFSLFYNFGDTSLSNDLNTKWNTDYTISNPLLRLSLKVGGDESCGLVQYFLTKISTRSEPSEHYLDPEDI
jgi:hypothetical protein